MARRLAFLCLGTMGYPMAGHLARAGHAVSVYNRTPGRARAWVEEYGGESAESPAEASRGAEVAFVCTGNDDDLRQVVLGEEGVLAVVEEPRQQGGGGPAESRRRTEAYVAASSSYPAATGSWPAAATPWPAEEHPEERRRWADDGGDL